MHKYEAQVRWSRQDAKFTDNRYSRGHEWSFDGGVTVPASSSPTVVPLPYSVVAAVDPEEALVASVSSCHMLFFLYLAAKQGYVVEHYHDQAFGVMEKNQAGRLAFHRITLRPRIEFTGDRKPAAGELKALHHTAHEECYIANSLNCEVVVDDG